MNIRLCSFKESLQLEDAPFPLCILEREHLQSTLLWFVLVFFRVVIEKDIRKTVLYCQAEPLFHPELGSEFHPHDISAKKKGF